MPLTVFEPGIPVNERPQTHALDGAAIGIAKSIHMDKKFDFFSSKW